MKDSRTLRSLTREYELKCIRAMLGDSGRIPVFRSLGRALRKLAESRRLDPRLAEPLWIMAKAGYRATRGMDPAAMLSWFESAGVAVAREIEAREKKEWLDRLMSRGVFYLSSEHGDCAEDHVPYQGKLYVSSHWRERVRSPELRERVASCVRNRRIRTVEWVVGGPAWLCTRPNCRHTLIRVPLEEALGSSARALVRRYAPYEPKRDYGDPLSGRIRLVEALLASHPCEDLRKELRSLRKKKNRKR